MTNQAPPGPYASEGLSLYPGLVLFVKCNLSPVSICFASLSTSPLGNSQQILCVCYRVMPSQLGCKQPSCRGLFLNPKMCFI